MDPLRRYFRLLVSDWLAVVSGSVSVPATIVAAFGKSPLVQFAFGSFAVICLLVCGYRVWLGTQPTFTREREAAVIAEFQHLDAMAKAGLRFILVRGEVDEGQIKQYLASQKFAVPESNVFEHLSTDLNFLIRSFVGRWSINPIHQRTLEDLFSGPSS